MDETFHFLGVTLDPPPHRDVIGVQAALASNSSTETRRGG
jgi:hypothetical protein